MFKKQNVIIVSCLSKLVLYHLRQGFYFNKQFLEYQLLHYQSRYHQQHAIQALEMPSYKAILFGSGLLLFEVVLFMFWGVVHHQLYAIPWFGSMTSDFPLI